VLGLAALAAEALDHERRGGPHRVERRLHGDARLDRPDVVVVEDLDDVRLVDARDALRLLGVVDEQHPPALGGHEVRPGHDAQRRPGLVHREDRPELDDPLRHLGDQVLRARRGRDRRS
jgi:hypothetical protein